MLPIHDVLPELKAALRSGTNAVIIAPPGAGKTTGVPLALLDEPWMQARRLILLSPRRLAARAAASRMAALLGEPVGATVGYRMRLDSKVSSATRIEVVTEGVFTRQIVAEPDLSGVAAVLFDECHERSLAGDLGLALALDAQLSFRDDLRLLAMSATLDGARFATLMGGAPVIESQGRMFPVETRHVDRDPSVRIEQQVAALVRQTLAREAGSILVFLPGQREIERTAELLEVALADQPIALHGLYGAREAADQAAAIAPSSGRKIVLATSIAETSLTIDGVRIVIDSGLTRRPVFEPATGMTRLETGRVSRAAADQRRGRAGRLEPGLCIRLWAEAQTRSLAPFDPPEILVADSAGLMLDLAQWGVRDPAQLRWLDPPPAGAVSQARALLRAFDALGPDGAITPHGRLLARLPLPPRLAHMVLAATSLGHAPTAALIAGLIGERGLAGSDVDCRTRIERALRNAAARPLRQQAEQWARLAGSTDTRVSADAAGICLALAFPDRIAQARPGQRGQFLLANGRGAKLDAAHSLAGEDFLAVGEVAGMAEEARILLAAPLTDADLSRVAAGRITSEESAQYDPRLTTVKAARIERLGALVLSAKPLAKPADEVMLEVLAAAVRTQGLALIPAWPEVGGLLARIRFAAAALGQEAMSWRDDAVQEEAAQWLPVALGEGDRLSDITPASLRQALASRMDPALRRALETLAPERFHSPAGSSHAIDYGADGGPAVDIRLQALFGLGTHPMVGGGQVPLVLRLLSPGHKPVQTTSDLPGFWRGSYAAVRRDLRGRYPRHPWPEDPTAAQPTTRAKPRGT